MRTREEILNLLKNHRESKTALSMMKAELESFQGINSAEAIDALTFHHSEGEPVQTGSISDKTAVTAGQYKRYMENQNAEARGEIIRSISALQREVTLLEAAVHGLPELESAVITGLFFDCDTVSGLAVRLAMAERTVRRYKESGIGRITALYNRYLKLTGGYNETIEYGTSYLARPDGSCR